MILRALVLTFLFVSPVALSCQNQKDEKYSCERMIILSMTNLPIESYGRAKNKYDSTFKSLKTNGQLDKEKIKEFYLACKARQRYRWLALETTTYGEGRINANPRNDVRAFEPVFYELIVGFVNRDGQKRDYSISNLTLKKEFIEKRVNKDLLRYALTFGVFYNNTKIVESILNYGISMKFDKSHGLDDRKVWVGSTCGAHVKNTIYPKLVNIAEKNKNKIIAKLLRKSNIP